MFRSPELGRIPKLIDLDLAIHLSIENCNFSIEEEEISVEEAIGRTIAEDIIADEDWPLFDQAFYDGYAIRSEDVANASGERPVKLRIVGKIGTTDAPERLRLGSGEATHILCGAPLPVGADAVIRAEGAIVEGDLLVVRRPVQPYENTVRRGGDFKAGDRLLSRGDVIRPQDAGLIMELGRTRVRVYRRVKVGVIPVGNDLLEKAESGVPYPDTYARVVGLFLSVMGAEVRHSGVVPDDIEAIEQAIRTSVRDNDVTLVVAGASVASNDVVPDAVSRIGKILFHGVKVAPGKVSGLAIVEKRPVFLVPGHIGSALACLLLFVIPAMSHRMTGVSDPYTKVKARLTEDLEGRPGRCAFRTVALRYGEDGYEATPIRKQLGGSPFMTLATMASGFVVVDPGGKIPAGDEVVVRLFPGPVRAKAFG